jgi:hypothetical protein
MEDEEVIDIIGMHGTTLDCATSILDQGFRLNAGRCGSGVYLWAKGPFSYELARCWHATKCYDEKWASTPEKACCVLNVVGKTLTLNYLDFEAPSFREIVELYLYETGGEGEPSDIMSTIIADIESEIGAHLKVIRKQVTVPPGFGNKHIKSYRRDILSSCAIAYVIRDLNVIKNVDIVEMSYA